MSRIRAHLISSIIQVIYVQQLSTLFRYIINTYSMPTFVPLSCIITHLKHFFLTLKCMQIDFLLTQTVAPYYGF